MNVNLVRDKATGKSKGFAFICYEDQRSTVLAVDNLNGIKLVGKTLRVDHVQDYRPPKETDKTDDETRQLYMEGCAPKAEHPRPEKQKDPTVKSEKRHKSIKKEWDKRCTISTVLINRLRYTVWFRSLKFRKKSQRINEIKYSLCPSYANNVFRRQLGLSRKSSFTAKMMIIINFRLNLVHVCNILLFSLNLCRTIGNLFLFNELRLLKNLQIIFHLIIDWENYTDLTYELPKTKNRVTRGNRCGATLPRRCAPPWAQCTSRMESLPYTTWPAIDSSRAACNSLISRGFDSLILSLQLLW